MIIDTTQISHGTSTTSSEILALVYYRHMEGSLQCTEVVYTVDSTVREAVEKECKIKCYHMSEAGEANLQSITSGLMYSRVPHMAILTWPSSVFSKVSERPKSMILRL